MEPSAQAHQLFPSSLGPSLCSFDCWIHNCNLVASDDIRSCSFYTVHLNGCEQRRTCRPPHQTQYSWSDIANRLRKLWWCWRGAAIRPSQSSHTPFFRPSHSFCGRPFLGSFESCICTSKAWRWGLGILSVARNRILLDFNLCTVDPLHLGSLGKIVEPRDGAQMGPNNIDGPIGTSPRLESLANLLWP